MRLNVITLTDNAIGDEGAQALAGALPQCTLHYLNLGCKADLFSLPWLSDPARYSVKREKKRNILRESLCVNWQIMELQRRGPRPWQGQCLTAPSLNKWTCGVRTDQIGLKAACTAKSGNVSDICIEELAHTTVIHRASLCLVGIIGVKFTMRFAVS
eukprot:scaffold423078_cov29-Prasinocladus_malaysianus.AAC.2